MTAGDWNTTDWRAGEISRSPVSVPAEKPVELCVNGRLLAVIYCTPDHLQELAAGFLLGQGLIMSYAEIAACETDAQRGRVTVSLHRPLEENDAPAPLNRRIIYSGCGQGPAVIPEGPARVLENRTPFDPGLVRQALADTLRRGGIYRQTHGSHSAAVCSRKGMILVHREDIGRHNALDKALGWTAARCLDPDQLFVAATGRVSSEAVGKLSRFGIPLIVSRGVPTSLALEMAEELGITLTSSLGPGRIRIYTHADRLRLEELP